MISSLYSKISSMKLKKWSGALKLWRILTDNKLSVNREKPCLAENSNRNNSYRTVKLNLNKLINYVFQPTGILCGSKGLFWMFHFPSFYFVTLSSKEQRERCFQQTLLCKNMLLAQNLRKRLKVHPLEGFSMQNTVKSHLNMVTVLLCQWWRLWSPPKSKEILLLT